MITEALTEEVLEIGDTIEQEFFNNDLHAIAQNKTFNERCCLLAKQKMTKIFTF